MSIRLKCCCGDTGFFAKLTGETDGVYTANKVNLNSSGAFAEADPQQTISGLKEANGQTGLYDGETDTYVWIYSLRESDGDAAYRFVYGVAGIQFYKIVSDYSLDDDTVTAHPCDYDGGNVDTETTVTCYIESPWANSINMPKRDAKINANDIVAGFPFGENKAMLLPLPPNVDDSEEADYIRVATIRDYSGTKKTAFNWKLKAENGGMICGGKTETGKIVHKTVDPPPDEDGTYTLQCDVEADTKTIDWTIATNILLDGIIHSDTKEGEVQQGDLITGQLDAEVPKWSRLAKGTSQSILHMASNDPAWLAKGDNGAVLTINNSGNLTWLSPPAGPAVLCYDETSGVRWLSLSSAYHGAFRSDSNTVESTPQKAVS